MKKRLCRPRLTVAQILRWADAHYQQTGAWPNLGSGKVRGVPGESWQALNQALGHGFRGLRGGSSLGKLMARCRRQRKHPVRVPLTEPQILDLADAHFQLSGHWPSRYSGPTPGSLGLTWLDVDRALCDGLRGLPGGSSLARLLTATGRKRKLQDLPRLTCAQVESWVRLHFQRTGQWPHCRSGPILEAPAESWNRIDMSLRIGGRGLPGGSSLARLVRRMQQLWFLNEYVPIRAKWAKPMPAKSR